MFECSARIGRVSVALTGLLMLLPACEPPPDDDPMMMGGDDSFQQSQSALDEIWQTIAGLSEPSKAAENQKILEYLMGRPDVESAGANDTGIVWAHLTNGRSVCVVNNYDTMQYPEGDADAAPLKPANHGPRSPAAKTVPSISSLLVNGLPGNSRSAIPRLKMLLEANAYLPAVQPRDSVDAWLNMQPVSIFHMESHGGAAERKGVGDEYYVSIGLEVNATNDSALLGHLGASFNDFLYVGIDRRTAERMYMVNRSFMETFVKLDGNALVWINACHSNSEGAASFVKTFFDLGAVAYAGWDDAAKFLDAEAAALYVYDMMLGSNVSFPIKTAQGEGQFLPDPPDPLRRAFTFGSALNFAAPTKADAFPFHDFGTPGVQYHKSENEDGEPSTLVYTRHPDLPTDRTNVQLAPSIYFVEVDESKDELIIHGSTAGNFDANRAGRKVLVNGAEFVDDVEWEENKVVLKTSPRPRTASSRWHTTWSRTTPCTASRATRVG